MSGRNGLRAIAAAIAATAALALAPAGASAASYAVGSDCQEQQAFVEGDDAAVAARLPKAYTPIRTASGRPLVFARGLRCRDVALDGTSGPAVMASYGVVIESPDGRGCGSGSPSGSVKGDDPPVCNWYVLAWLAGDRRTLDWLRAGTPGFPVVHVPELVFDLGTFDPARGGAPFSFRAGGPSPYTIDAVTRDGPHELSVRGGYWADTPQGTVKLALSSDDLVAGDASGTVRTPAGTELAKLMGAEERPYAPVFSGFSTVRAAHGVYRKQILPPEGSKAGFSGSCSTKGTVTFKPTPAKNESQALSSDYTGEGTCTGTLDGRELKDAPVTLYHSGHAEGGCQGAKTTAPWPGTLKFASGEVVRYTLDFTSTATEINGTMYGERSGVAPGRASFLTDRTPPDVAARCAGDGVTETPLDLSFATESPLVNEPGGPGPKKPGARRRSLRLAVSPRTVASGRRTRFAFRVTTVDGRPVEGAFVRFFGRRVRTGASGGATIAATLRGRGRHPARVAKPGFRSGTGAVRVRHP